MKSTTIISALLLLIGATLSAQGVELQPDRSITYKSVYGIELKMDIFEPAGLKATDHRPAIVFFSAAAGTAGAPSSFINKPGRWPIKAWWLFRPTTA